MDSKYRTLSLFSFALVLAALPLAWAHKAPEKAKPAPEPVPGVGPSEDAAGGKIQVALLLDTSSSMDGLIDQAKSQLWKVVNELSSAKRNGHRPRLEIALYEYGKATLSPESGFIRQISAFTGDLDRVSEQLFGLTTNGGEEYCGQVIRDATHQLAWSKDPHDLKLIFIAGNEPFTQGTVDYHQSVREAVAKGITVNTIYCGASDSSETSDWKSGAVLADGRFMSIDQNRVVATIPAPQDGQIAKLGEKLNETYIPYGISGEESWERQAKQDANANQVAQGAMVQRSISKASSAYSNSSWDLVDAVKNGLDSRKLQKGALPKVMQGMSDDERDRFVAAKSKDRVEIQRQIAELNTERTKFVAAEQAKLGAAQNDSLDQAMIAAVHGEATKAGFVF
jgi:hypothetical protein